MFKLVYTPQCVLSNYTTQVAELSELEKRSPEGNLVEGTLLVCLHIIHYTTSFQHRARCLVPSLTRTFSADGLWTHWRSWSTGLNKPHPSLEWNGATSRASLVKRLTSGKIVLMRVSKSKTNTLNICYDVFLRNCHDHSPRTYDKKCHHRNNPK